MKSVPKTQYLYKIPRETVRSNLGELFDQLVFLDKEGRWCVEEEVWMRTAAENQRILNESTVHADVTRKTPRKRR